VLNDDLGRQIQFQKNKRKSIEDFERRLITEEEYELFVGELTSYDDVLVKVSLQFSDLTKEAKRIIDEAKAASEQRKETHGFNDNEPIAKRNHRQIPDKIVSRINDAQMKVSKLILISV